MGLSVRSEGDYEMAVLGNKKAVKILAFGDSWLSNPGSNSSFSIVKSIAGNFDVVIYSLTMAGKETAYSLSRGGLEVLLKKYENHNRDERQKFDVVLVSAGGSDIIEKSELKKLLVDKNDLKEEKHNIEQFINKTALDNKIKSIISLYEEIISRLIKINSEAKIITHNYGVAAYLKKGTRMLGIPVGGSWIESCFTEKHITDEKIQRDVFRYIFTHLSYSLIDLQKKYSGNFKVIETQRLIHENDWKDEIHLTSAGCEKIAKEIYNEGIANR
ncbi:MAG: SGNH/GDSL hydrolase family protein [Spirochaetia bacterium]|jgi:hypothetical protein|nr:SGNH/GDSL hydrolase family protein [Spirochaetia bacterium]